MSEPLGSVIEARSSSAPGNETVTKPRGQRMRVVPYLLIVAAVGGICVHTLSSTAIDGLDSAHHIMDGVFFRDFLTDIPLLHPIAYTINYYKQYPALGFLFWPPLFPALEGVAFLVGGVDIRIARLCIFGFALLFAILLYRLLNRRLGPAASSITVLLLCTIPLFCRFSNEVMLELPVLAMGTIVITAYEQMISTPTTRWSRALLVAVSGAAALYTKQPIAFLVPVLFLDVLINHKKRLLHKQLWVAAAVFVIMILPLVYFTVVFGKANLEQSFGNDRSFVFPYIPNRWTLMAWTLYPRLLTHVVNPVILLLGAGGIVYSCLDRAFAKANVIWIAWIVVWYLFFSYFLAKDSRYAVLWLPGWVVLGMSFLARISQKLPHRRWLLIVPCIGIALNVPAALNAGEPGFSGMDKIIASVIRPSGRGNIAYFGDHRQVFVPFIRKADQARRIWVLQGERILETSGSLDKALFSYRVEYLMFEDLDDPTKENESLRRMAANGLISPVLNGTIQTTPRKTLVHVFRYSGEMSPTMAPVRFSSRFVDTTAVRRLE
jgi:hypothetical protein